jgi:rare lipoprotein A (peptidoglycan hydrolase)
VTLKRVNSSSQKTQTQSHFNPIYAINAEICLKKNQVTAAADKDVEKEEHSSIAGGIASWYNHSGNQFGGSSEN